MVSILDRLKNWWTGADRNQRVVTLGGIGALLLLLLGTAFFATRPRYETLLEGLSDIEQGQAVEALDGLGIPNQHDRKGVVAVPSEKVSDARMGLAKADKLPKGSNHLHFADLAKIGPMASPDVEAETIKAIQQGEIASTLETMEGVASANVIITRPKETVFADEKQAPTASVMLTESGRGTLTAENGRTIANFVCASVDGMKLSDVYVASNTLGVLWDGHGGDSASSKGDLDAKTARYWESHIQAALDEVYGSRNTRVIVRADVNTSKGKTVTHDVVPTRDPTARRTEQEDMANASRTPSGAAGTVTNSQERALAGAPESGKAGGSYKKKGKQEEFGAGWVDKEVELGTGDLTGLAITVVANSDKIQDASSVKDIVDGVMGGKIEMDDAGVVKPNQPFTTKVTSVKFDGTAAAAVEAARQEAAGKKRNEQIMSLLPIAAILIVALLVAKQVGKISRAILPAPQEADASLAEGMDDLDALPQSEFEMAALPAGEAPAEEEAARFLLDPIKDKVDIPLESLKQMAEERPEMVATLIKSMMLGEK